MVWEAEVVIADIGISTLASVLRAFFRFARQKRMQTTTITKIITPQMVPSTIAKVPKDKMKHTFLLVEELTGL